MHSRRPAPEISLWRRWRLPFRVPNTPLQQSWASPLNQSLQEVVLKVPGIDWPDQSGPQEVRLFNLTHFVQWPRWVQEVCAGREGETHYASQTTGARCSATPSPVLTEKTLPLDPDDADFSPQGNYFIARLQAITEGLAPSVFAGPDQTRNDNEDAGTSVSEATAVPAGLASDIGSRIQRRLREIEDKLSRFLSDSVNRFPVPAQNFVMSRLFDLAASCGDLRAEAVMERGAAAALRCQLIETRQEMATLQASGMGTGRGGALAGPVGSGDVDVRGTRGRGIPEIPPAVPGVARSYAAALTGSGRGAAAQARGPGVGCREPRPHIRITNTWRS
ncbi:hypothetical protein MRX96_005046 [Rhipicephalus microplus]